MVPYQIHIGRDDLITAYVSENQLCTEIFRLIGIFGTYNYEEFKFVR